MWVEHLVYGSEGADTGTARSRGYFGHCLHCSNATVVLINISNQLVKFK